MASLYGAATHVMVDVVMCACCCSAAFVLRYASLQLLWPFGVAVLAPLYYTASSLSITTVVWSLIIAGTGASSTAMLQACLLLCRLAYVQACHFADVGRVARFTGLLCVHELTSSLYKKLLQCSNCRVAQSLNV